MNVSSVLQQAWTAVQDADLPSDMHVVAFREAMRILAPSPSTSTVPATGAVAGSSAQRVAGSKSSDQGSDDAVEVGATEDEIYDRVAVATGANRERLERLAHLDDGLLRISLPGLKLGRTNAERTRAVAQVLTIMRGFGLEEEGTPLEVVRAECIRLKVYDRANFASNVGKLPGFLVVGSGQNRRLRPKAAAISTFAAFVDDLVDEG